MKFIDCKGSGTKSDPVIIDPSSIFPKECTLWRFQPLEIRGSNIFLKISNIDNLRFLFSNCQNISIENCVFSISKYLNKYHPDLKFIDCRNVTITNSEIKYIRLHKCFSFSFENTHISKKVLLDSCQELSIENSNIYTLFMDKCYNNIFKTNNIERIKILVSRGNLFEKNNILEKELMKIESNKDEKKKRNIHIKGIILLDIVCFLAVLLSFNSLFYSIPLIIVGIVMQFIIYIIIKENKKEAIEIHNQIPPNKIISSRINLIRMND